jgi:two-component system response regulator DctR
MRVNGFRVVGAASSADAALTMIAAERPHLLLLDLALRGATGVALLRKLRAIGSPLEVIAVTALRDADTVRSLVHLGVLDYLVKPFTPERLHQALSLFLHRMATLGPGQLDQEQVDELSASGRLPRRWLPKGLTEPALRSVRDVLAASATPVPASLVSERTGLARVTVRRYLEYLVATQQAGSSAESTGPGRPRKLYWALRI